MPIVAYYWRQGGGHKNLHGPYPERVRIKNPYKHGLRMGVFSPFCFPPFRSPLLFYSFLLSSPFPLYPYNVLPSFLPQMPPLKLTTRSWEQYELSRGLGEAPTQIKFGACFCANEGRDYNLDSLASL